MVDVSINLSMRASSPSCWKRDLLRLRRRAKSQSAAGSERSGQMNLGQSLLRVSRNLVMEFVVGAMRVS